MRSSARCSWIARHSGVRSAALRRNQIRSPCARSPAPRYLVGNPSGRPHGCRPTELSRTAPTCCQRCRSPGGGPRTRGDLAALFADLLPYYLHRRDPASVVPLVDGTIFRSGGAARVRAARRWSSVGRRRWPAPCCCLAGGIECDTRRSYSNACAVSAIRLRSALPLVLFHGWKGL